MSYSIRKAQTKDVESLSQLFVEFIGTKSDCLAMKEKLEIVANDPNYFVAVACDGDKVIGTSMAIKCHDLVGNCNSFLLVENVVVLPQYRGNGVGKLLMQSIEDFGIDQNCNYIMLVSGNKRGAAHDFYRSMGYSDDNQGFKKRLFKQG